MMQTQVRGTSVSAYRGLNDLNTRQRQVLALLAKKDMTNMELSKALGLPINSITGRVNELRKKGFVADMGVTQCRFTGRRVHKWGLPIEGPQIPLL